MNTLVIETAFLGDTIISLALARELKRLDPTGSITYLVRAGIEEIAQASPDVDSAIPFDKRGTESGVAGIEAKTKELNQLGFDTLILLHGSRRSQELALRIHCKRKIGFEAMTHAGLTITVPDTGWKDRYERSILPLRAIFPDANVRSISRVIPKPYPPIDSFLMQWKNTVILAPGSAWETKKWGDEKFLELASELTKIGIGVIVIGSNSERELAENIRVGCPNNSVSVLAGTATFLEAMSAIAKASVVVANDSAPVHAAIAVGTKVLAIYGPTVPAFGFSPLDGTGETIELTGLWCRPCTPHGSHDCPVYTHNCMRGISVSSVMKKIEEMLAGAIS